MLSGRSSPFSPHAAQISTRSRRSDRQKRSGRSDYVNIRNLWGGWQNIFHREFDRQDCSILTLDSCTPQKLQPDSIPGIYTELMGDRMLLDLFDHIGDTISEPPKEELEARFSRLYQLFQPILVSYPRPVFLKKDLWEKRLARFHTTTII